MINLKIKRRYKGTTYTIGSLFVDDQYFCDTLEDTDRGLKQTDLLSTIKTKKVYGETAIPTGTYKVTLDVVSSKFKDKSWAKFCSGKLPRLLDVPGYDGVLIHVGNTSKDTLGCILVGQNKVKGQVINSTDTFQKLYNKIKGNDVSITIE